MRLFHSVPQTASTLSQELVVSVNLAKVKMQSQQFVSSLAHLRSLQPRIEGLHENLSLLDFYATLGEVCRNMGLQIEAEAADREAIAVFQASLATLHDARDRLTWYHEASAAYRSLVQLKLQQKDAKGALETWESYRESIEPLHQGNPSRPIRANRRDGTKRSAGISVVISKAGASETYDRKKIITYARLPDGLFGWIRADKSVQAARISGPNDEVIHLQTLFVQECSDPSSSKSKIADHGRQLYRKLVLPLAGRFSLGDTIVIEPDEELSDLPFAALLDETGQYFGSRYSLIISPGSRLGSAGRAVRRLTVQDVALLVVASTPADGRVHDPLAEEEVQSIAALFRNPVIISPMQSAKASFQQLLSQASVFHYAGHSQTTVRGGELLVQTRDRHGSVRGASLRSEDIERRSLRHCQLAVLSACDTGRGEEGRWFNRENLALAFLNAGVAEVVASQWQVDSNVTTRMMKDFYSRLIAGATTSDALRLAGAKVRSVPETSHPYYWAAFSVLSNASPGNGG
jgi:CHAT domain-containing protein